MYGGPSHFASPVAGHLVLEGAAASSCAHRSAQTPVGPMLLGVRLETLFPRCSQRSPSRYGRGRYGQQFASMTPRGDCPRSRARRRTAGVKVTRIMSTSTSLEGSCTFPALIVHSAMVFVSPAGGAGHAAPTATRATSGMTEADQRDD